MSPDAPGQREQREDEDQEAELDKLIQQQGGEPELTDEQIAALLRPPAPS